MRLAPLLFLLPALAAASCRDEGVTPDPPRAPSGAGPDASRSPDSGPDAPAPREPGTRIASLNVHRLFDTVCHSNDCGPEAYEEAPEQEVFDAKIRRLSAGIRRLEAEVVLLQEVETQACLDALVGQLPELKHAVLGETGWAASVDVAVLSAIPIASVRSHKDRRLPLPDGRTTTFSRDLLEVHLDSGEGELVVFVAHFRSKVNDDPERRLAEARAAREIVADAALASPRAVVVLGGDINDLPGSPPLEALTEGGALARVSEGLPAAEIGTYRYGGDWLALDHLFLARSSPGKAVPGSFRVFREAYGWAGSDHAAIRASFSR